MEKLAEKIAGCFAMPWARAVLYIEHITLFACAV